MKTGLLMLLPFLVTASEAVAVLAPGATWEYTFSNPTADPAWDTTTGGWSTGPAPFGNESGAVAGDFAYATFWAPDAPQVQGDDDLWVRKTIDLTGLDLTSAAWALGVDNGFKLYANGTLVGSGDAGGYTHRWEYSGGFAGSLHGGINYIAVALDDYGGSTAFDMQITANAQATGVPDGNASTGLLLCVAAAGLIFARRNA